MRYKSRDQRPHSWRLMPCSSARLAHSSWRKSPTRSACRRRGHSISDQGGADSRRFFRDRGRHGRDAARGMIEGVNPWWRSAPPCVSFGPSARALGRVRCATCSRSACTRQAARTLKNTTNRVLAGRGTHAHERGGSARPKIAPQFVPRIMHALLGRAASQKFVDPTRSETRAWSGVG